MTAALASRVEEALEGLGESERTALELRTQADWDYAAIGAQLGTRREGVADLLVAARLGLRAAMHGETPPPPRITPQCGPARRVLAARADGEAVSLEDTTRAREHVEGCEPCLEARLALREAELACRSWSSAERSDSPDPAPAVSLDRPQKDGQATHRARGRRRIVAAVVALVLFGAIVAAALTSGSDDPPAPAAPPTGQGSADAPGKDVVPPPGDRFCPAEQPDCK